LTALEPVFNNYTQLDSTILTFVGLRNDFGKVADHSEIPDQFQTYQPLSKVLNGLPHSNLPTDTPGERKKSMALGT
jgi:hypothetical protein